MSNGVRQRSPSSTNTLAVLFPEIASQWHPSRNGVLTPDRVVAGSHKRCWWKCPEGQDHVWLASVKDRTYAKSGCVFCAGRAVSSTNSLASLFPEITREWHPTKNGTLTPNKIVAGSTKIVWWSCPKGPDHEWQTKVVNRTSKGTTGCPFCGGDKASIANSLATLYPDVAAQWHPTKNGDITRDANRGWIWEKLLVEVQCGYRSRVEIQCCQAYQGRSRLPVLLGEASFSIEFIGRCVSGDCSPMAPDEKRLHHSQLADRRVGKACLVEMSGRAGSRVARYGLAIVHGAAVKRGCPLLCGKESLNHQFFSDPITLMLPKCGTPAGMAASHQTMWWVGRASVIGGNASKGLITNGRRASAISRMVARQPVARTVQVREPPSPIRLQLCIPSLLQNGTRRRIVASLRTKS